MKLKKIISLLLFCFVFVSCNPHPGDDPKRGNDGTENNGGTSSSEENGGASSASNNESSDSDEQKNNSTKVQFENKSSYTVNVYYGSSPLVNTEPKVTVESNDSAIIDFVYTGNTETFFFQYCLTIESGRNLFPYYPKDDRINHQSLKIKENEINEVVISEINECNTKSAFLVLDNQSDAQIYILQKDNPVKPFGKDDKFIPVGESGIYEIGDEGTMLYQTMAYAQVCMNASTFDLPKITYEANKIYVVKVTNEKAVLEAISPFNIDTGKRMWTYEDSKYLIEDGNRPSLRSCSNIENGSLLLGVDKTKKTSLLVTRLDVYGTVKGEYYMKFSLGDGKKLNSISVVDFLEQSDESIVVLVKYYYTEKGETYYGYGLLCYDYVENLTHWSMNLDENYYFRDNCKNVIFKVADNKIGVVGSAIYVNENEDNIFYPLLNVYDFTTSNGDGTFVYDGKKSFFEELELEEEYTNESMFTSGVYDGNNIYVCGFLNCDFNYDSVVHKGIIYKVNLENNSIEPVLEKDRCLFFSIDSVNGNWYASGEYWNPTGGLRGCYTNKQLVVEAKLSEDVNDTIYYAGNTSYSWFNQFCVYSDQVVLCGQSSENTDGSKNSEPFVVAFDLNGNKLWENMKYTKYKAALNIIPNTIGTYILQLTEKSGNTYYVSADLLGNEPSN